MATDAATIVDVSDDLLSGAATERTLTDLLRNGPTVTETEVMALLDRVVSDVETDYPAPRMTVDGPEAVTIRAAAEIKRAITELVTTALGHDESEAPRCRSPSSGPPGRPGSTSRTPATDP